MINGVHHVSLSTSNMDRFLHFYSDLIGLPLASDGMIEPGFTPFETVVGLRDTKARVAQLRAGNLRIEVFQYLEPSGKTSEAPRSCDVGIRHLAFDVTDIDSEYERLKAAGVDTFFSAPQNMGDFGMRSVYLRDPDGNIVELQEIFPGGLGDTSHIVGIS